MKNFIISRIGLTFIFALSLLLLAACGGGSDSAATEGNSDGGDKANSEKVYNLKMNSQNAPPLEGSPSHHAQVGFAELVKEKTNGRVNIEIFYSNQLAGQSESLDALARGTIDFHVGTPSAWADKIPEGNWSNLPFAWKNEEEVYHLLRETDFGKIYEEAVNSYGVKLLFYYHSAAAGYLSNKPISSPSDFKGVVTNMSGTLKGDFYKGMGAGIASIPFADFYEGLLRGTVDSVLYPYYAMESMKLAEVVKYVTVPGEVSPAIGIVSISQSAWDELPSDLQEIVMEAALQIEKETMPLSKAYTDKGLEYAKEQGLEIVEMSDESYNEFLARAKETVWTEFAAINDRTKKMAEILEENSAQ
ncbi:TRAP transporter substrate-binding protein [Bacillus dakarensis]|uniref:TRAP transporter substrate-binding protein n=1 Tax=Robertmurraya dakarensis TaxID=1926278 RepID=UPI000981D1BB|nr:TRAP transporter substrate-binding protein [Bacillus dakarensis]